MSTHVGSNTDPGCLARRARSKVARACRDDRGAVTGELVIIMPLVVTIILGLGQAAEYQTAQQRAQAAASHGLAATRMYDGTTHDGHAAANRALDQLGRGPLRDAQVSVYRDSTRASVTITGTVRSVVPFLHLPVRADAAGPTEAWRPS